MGGKRKQAQRTKGNVKPSSSARAAELLVCGSQSTSSLGFVGFDGLSDGLGYVPAAASGEEVDSSINADFRIVLRKLSKKDATTKLKALQEFSSLCQEKDTEAIKSVLPFWPRVYNKVAIDHDRRVREASQQAFEQLVLRIRRNLAPYLKSLMGTWLVAQNDIYAPAASAARSAFNAAFPPTKQTEALVFCKDEILSHLHENLIVHTAQTLSDLKTTEPEDMEAKYNRMLCASLNALKTFLSVVPPDQQESLIDKYKLILNSNRFWKYAKHNQTMIQGSFYGVLSALCQHQPNLAREYSSKISPITLHNLDNTDPLVCRTLWEAVLCTVSTLEDCWTHVNLKKGVLPGLWRLLSTGGSGSASVIYPNLLPFLSQLPPDLRSGGVQFYKDFFDNMKAGLTTEKVRVSPSELDAIVQAFMECLQYTISQNLTEPLFMDFVLNDELMPLMMSALLEDTLLVCTTLYPKMVDLVTYLYKSSTDKNGKRATAASALLSSIMQSLKQLDIIEQDKEKCLKRYAAFLCTFKGNNLPNSGKAVRFSGAEEVNTLDTSKKNQLDFPQVLDLVSDACRRAYRQSISQKSLATLEFFNQVTKSYDIDDIFGALWSTSYQDVLGDVIIPWMAEYNDLLQDKRVCQSFVGIITTLFHQCTAAGKVLFLSKAIQCIQDVFILHLFLQVVYNDITDKEVRDWFRGKEFGQRIVDVAKALCRQCSLTNDGISDERKTQAQWELLKLAFTSDDRLEPLLDEKYLSVILGEIHAALPSPDTARVLTESEVIRCISFICDVSFNFFSNVKGCLSLPVAEALLLSLFQLSCQEQFAKTDGCAEKIRKTWRKGVDALIKQRGGLLSDDGFFHDAVEYIRSCLLEEHCMLERLKTLADVTLSLAECVSHQLKKEAGAATFTDPAVLAFLSRVYQPMSFTDLPQWQMPVVLSHEITFEALPEMSTDYKPSDLIPRCIMPVAYAAQLLSVVVNDHLANEIPVNRDVISAEQVCNITFAMVLSNSLLHYQKQTSGNSTDLSKVNELLQTSLLSIIKNSPESAVNEMIHQMLERSVKEGNLWSLSLNVLLHESSKYHSVTDMLHITRDLDVFNELDEAKLHTLQVIVPYLDDETVSNLLDIQAECVLVTSPDRIITIPGCRSSLAVLSKIIQNRGMLTPSQATSDPVKHIVPLQTLLLVLSHIQATRQEHEELFLFDCCVSEQQWQVVSFNIELMHFMKLLVEKYAMQLTSDAWDFILCSLIAWIQSCSESKVGLSSELKTQTFAMTAFILLKQVAENFSSAMQAHEEGCYENLVTEWLEFFSEGIYSLLLPIFVEVAGGTQAIPSPSTSLMLSSLSSSICLCPVPHLRQNSLPMKLIAGDECHLPESYQTTLNHLCPLLLNPNRAVQLTAYRLLLSLMAELSQYDDKQDVADEDDKPARSPPAALMSSLLVSSEALNTVLHNVATGERCEIDIESEEYVITMAYLLSWQLLLSLFRGAKVELRAEYAQYLRNNNLVEVLLDVLYKLMPESPILQQCDISAQNGAKEKSAKSMFEEEPLFDVQEVRKEVDILHMSCTVYFHALQDLPALIRHWYNSVDKRMSTIANRYTTKYVSPVLCNLEIRAVQDANVKLDNMTIKTRPAAREVAATYTVEELTMELVVTLPNNHPLGQITVECGKRIGVASAQWRNWMLQLTTFLHRQNGSILDGLTLWRRNVNKRFEGVEECMICFSVIHGSNCQLPKLQCKTCKKRFHSACLYKWFNTSNNSSCPMCRNLF